MKGRVKEILFFRTGNTVAVTLPEVEKGSQDLYSWKLMHRDGEPQGIRKLYWNLHI